MKQNFTSTRGFFDEKLQFLDVVRQGLAEDGGLFLPVDFEKFSTEELQNLRDKNYREIAFSTLRKFPLGDLSDEKLRELIEVAYGDNFDTEKIVPVTSLNSRQHLLELWHGPTAAFKDLALQLTPRFFAESIRDEDGKFLILAATSGDTGSATIAGYRELENVKVCVLYPTAGVSPVQEQQMLSMQSPNIRVIPVEADFDFCQSAVKEIFTGREIRDELSEKYDTCLSSANSINWGRLLPQVAYYTAAYLRLVGAGKLKFGAKLDVVVPTGNFGNILAAWYAKQLGVPLGQLVVASNENCVIADFIRSGAYDLRKRELTLTTSPSIDILKSSNLERLIYLLSGSAEKVAGFYERLATENIFEIDEELKNKIQAEFSAGVCDEAASLQTVRETLEKENQLLDTHTAVARKVADEQLGETPQLIASTAHFGKFPAAICQSLTGEDFSEKSLPEIFVKIGELALNQKVPAGLQAVIVEEVSKPKNCPGNIEAVLENLREFLK